VRACSIRILGTLAFLAGCSSAQGDRAVFDRIEARSIRTHTLSADEIAVVDSNGKLRATLCQTDTGIFALSLWAGDPHEIRAMLFVDREGGTGLTMTDGRPPRDGKPFRMVLTVPREGDTKFVMWDKNGTVVFKVP